MKLRGMIVAADSTEKTITIKCDTSISGVTLAAMVTLIEDEPEKSIFKSNLPPSKFERLPGE